MNATDKTADKLRAALKAAGFNRKMVTVKHDHYSMGSTLYVTIRDASIGRATVAAISEQFENVRRDEYGDILSGGNTHLHLEYARGVLEVVATPIAQQLAAAAIGVPVEINGDRYVKLADGVYGGSVIQDVDADGVGGSRMNAHCGNPADPTALMFAARQIAERAIAIGEAAAVVQASELATVALELVPVVAAEDWAAGL